MQIHCNSSDFSIGECKVNFSFWCCNGLVCLRNTALNFLHSWGQFLHQLLLDVTHLGPYSANAETWACARVHPHLKKCSCASWKFSLAFHGFCVSRVFIQQRARLEMLPMLFLTQLNFLGLVSLWRSLNHSIQLKKIKTTPYPTPTTNQNQPNRINSVNVHLWVAGGC